LPQIFNSPAPAPSEPYLEGHAYVGYDLRVVAPDSDTQIKVDWWCGGRCVTSGTGSDALIRTLQDADDGHDIHAELIWTRGARTLRATTPILAVTTPAPRLRPLMLDDVMDQHTGPQPLPAGSVFEGRALRYRVLRGDADIDPNTGLLQIPTDQARSAGQIVVEGRNSGGAELYHIQYAVEGDDSRAATSRTSQLLADGVTFTFDREVETGTFITGAMGAGDPFVVGPTTLVSYTPGPITIAGRDMNGAMLNPPCSSVSGFDSLTSHRAYQESANAGRRLPLFLVPGDSLIVTISNPQATNERETADHFVVLTCLDEAPYADSFRPPYSGSERPIWRASDIDPGQLARLENKGRAAIPDPRALSLRFGRFALEIARSWNRVHLAGAHHAPLYGRDICTDESSPFVVANLDIPYALKTPFLYGLIQRGIDRYGAFRSAREQGFYPWQTDGAHHSGRKFSIMFAGHLLKDEAMRHVTRQATDFSTADAHAFHEDGQTFHVTPKAVAISNSDAWRPPYGNNDDRPKQPYIEAMISMPDWRGKPQDDHVNAAWNGHPYRISGNHNTQHGQVLAALAMGLKDAWDHDAYFDYHIRFMELMGGRYDPWRFRGGDQALYNPVEGSRPANGFDNWAIYYNDQWAWRMLLHYRFDYYSYPWA
jgi:hypothetical protein